MDGSLQETEPEMEISAQALLVAPTETTAMFDEDPQVEEPIEVVDDQLAHDTDLESEKLDAVNEEPVADSRMTHEDLKLPETTIVKIMKEVIPHNAIISKDVKDRMRRIAVLFIFYITDGAITNAQKHYRKTLLPEDVVKALEEQDFEEFAQKVSFMVPVRPAKEKKAPAKQRKKVAKPKSLSSALQKIHLDDEVEVIMKDGQNEQQFHPEPIQLISDEDEELQSGYPEEMYEQEEQHPEGWGDISEDDEEQQPTESPKNDTSSIMYTSQLNQAFNASDDEDI